MNRRNPQRRVLMGVSILGAVIAIGSLWYWLIEGFGFLDAVFQTVTTVSTVGFREIQPLDDSGRIFTMIVILVGVGAALYTLTALFEELVETQVFGRRRMDRKIDRLHDHAVVCGYGRIGARVAELLSHDRDVLVIEQDSDRVNTATDAGLAVVHGDATDEDTLTKAHLEAASVLIAALPTDADNLYVVLSGRSSSSELRIVARAQSLRSDPKLIRAGADRVVNPEDIGAHRLAAFAQRPNVSEFLDVVMHDDAIEYRLEEVTIAAQSALVGQSVHDAAVRDRTGAMVLGLRHPDGSFVTNPGADLQLEAGSVLIAIGNDEQLNQLGRVAADSQR